MQDENEKHAELIRKIIYSVTEKPQVFLCGHGCLVVGFSYDGEEIEKRTYGVTFQNVEHGSEFGSKFIPPKGFVRAPDAVAICWKGARCESCGQWTQSEPPQSEPPQ